MERLETTLLLLKKENKILLAKKKKGFGQSKLNGIGGKLEIGETPEMAMIRETQEEIFVTPTVFSKVGLLHFTEFYKGVKKNVVIHLFVATNWVGEPKESEEMIPQWFDISHIPYSQMFQDDSFWLPYILEDKKIDGFFEFDENWNLLSHEIKEVENF